MAIDADESHQEIMHSDIEKDAEEKKGLISSPSESSSSNTNGDSNKNINKVVIK